MTVQTLGAPNISNSLAQLPPTCKRNMTKWPLKLLFPVKKTYSSGLRLRSKLSRHAFLERALIAFYAPKIAPTSMLAMSQQNSFTSASGR